MTAKELLTAVRVAQGIPSNYRLALIVGVRENAVQRWNSGRGAPDDAMAARLAELAGLDPDSVVASMYALRAQDETDRARWERIAARLSKAASVAAAVILSLCITGKPDAFSPMGTAQAAPVNSAVHALYIVHCFARRVLQSLASALRQVRPIGAPCCT
jgi:hypothetical protein